jgi:hypothetical protein
MPVINSRYMVEVGVLEEWESISVQHQLCLKS